MSFSRKNEKGFTVVEIVFAILVLAILAGFFVVQRNSIEAGKRDQQRKTAVNAMYYNLKEVYFAKNKSYPKTISRDNLTAIDPDLFTDPNGGILNGEKCSYKNGAELSQSFCNYHYQPSDCDSEGKCKNFKITADMETESEYSKSSY